MIDKKEILKDMLNQLDELFEAEDEKEDSD